MALDEALLEAVAAGSSPPILRLYRWQPAAISLGYAQRGADVVNLAACRRLGLDVVRRCTGGRAVLHDREVTYAVIAREGEGLFPGRLGANYQLLAPVLDQLLASYGLTVARSVQRLRPGSAPALHSACFTAPAQFEQVVAGHKLTGSAQKRQQGAFLQHGSIPLDLDTEQLFAALDTRGKLTAAEGARLLAAKVGWLNRYLPQPVTVDAVEERLVALFAAHFTVTLQPDLPQSAELARCATLVNERYGCPDWNFAGLTDPATC